MEINGSSANFQAMFSNMEWFLSQTYGYTFRNYLNFLSIIDKVTWIEGRISIINKFNQYLHNYKGISLGENKMV